MAIVLNARWSRDLAQPAERQQTLSDPAEYREFVFRCALAICGEPDGAEDVAQEVMLVLISSRTTLAETAHPQAWIRKVTVRQALRHLKRLRRTEPLSENTEVEDRASGSFEVLQVLQGMKPADRALLGMAMGQGLAYREIAEALGVPEGTVASRLSAAKKEFQRRWEQ
jgi:RNA polymerase sigma-70 factor (ECF subfamily)